jgi:hypothetical protein
VRDPGDDRLSRRRHYHGPGGLNGRVRDGNGCGPAGVVAGNPRGRRSGRAARRDDRGWSVTPGRVGYRPGGVSGKGLVPRGGVAGSACRHGVSPPGLVPGVRHGVQTRETSWVHTAEPACLRSGGRRVGVVKRSAVGTGPLRRSPAVHSQPIDLVVFQEPSHSRAGNLVLKRASRLDAFSAYPFPTWLPGGAPSGTAGTPEVGPPQSSRTRGDPSQVSDAHGR